MPHSAALQAVVSGRVQMVAFRAFVSRKADGLGVTGYVRNLPDGNVEVLAEGDRNRLDDLLESLKQGPPAAHVDHVEVRWSEPKGNYRRFRVRLD